MSLFFFPFPAIQMETSLPLLHKMIRVVGQVLQTAGRTCGLCWMSQLTNQRICQKHDQTFKRETQQSREDSRVRRTQPMPRSAVALIHWMCRENSSRCKIAEGSYAWVCLCVREKGWGTGGITLRNMILGCIFLTVSKLSPLYYLVSLL